MEDKLNSVLKTLSRASVELDNLSYFFETNATLAEVYSHGKELLEEDILEIENMSKTIRDFTSTLKEGYQSLAKQIS